MPTLATATPTRHRGSELLALGFGTTVTMWAIGYVLRFPGLQAPSWLLLLFLLSTLVAGGALARHLTDRGPRVGLIVGLLTGLLNLLILGSLLSGDRPGAFVPDAIWWVPGSFLLCGALGLLGAAVAGRRREASAPFLARHGVAAFAHVAAAATFLLIVAGGIVTSSQAGLAVTDWPNSYGYNMFLYPLARMSGGIYYEHVHRLLGSLVGLSTLVLTVVLLRVEDRRWVKGLAVGALLLVITQGILGGLRVTGHFTMSDDPAVTRPNLLLAVIHGVVGQLFLGTMVALASITTRRWREAQPVVRGEARTELRLAPWLLGAIVLQLTLGSVLRHVNGALHAHLTLAVVVLSLGLVLGMRLLGRYHDIALLRRLGRVLVIGLSTQFVLGFAALIGRSLRAADGGPHPLDVTLTTLHQATGAFLLATAVLTTIWVRHLVRAPSRLTHEERSP